MEIRVHGVGGTPPEDLLGTAGRADLVRVGGDGKSAFFARREQRSVEGYHWGPLTSGALLQPLWIFLLPFTLFNVGAWMLPARSGGRLGGWGWKVARLLILALGLTLTASYVFGASTIVVKQLFYQWGLKGILPQGHVRLLCGAGAMILLIFVVFRFVARGNQIRRRSRSSVMSPWTPFGRAFPIRPWDSPRQALELQSGNSVETVGC